MFSNINLFVTLLLLTPYRRVQYIFCFFCHVDLLICRTFYLSIWDETKFSRNETKFLQNEAKFRFYFFCAKRNKILHNFVSRNKRNFGETGEAFVSFRVSRNKNKAKIKNPNEHSTRCVWSGGTFLVSKKDIHAHCQVCEENNEPTFLYFFLVHRLMKSNRICKTHRGKTIERCRKLI